MPNFMKNQLGPVFARMTPDVVFEDKVYGYNMKGVSSLNFHLLKIRSYFRYKSPFVQMEVMFPFSGLIKAYFSTKDL